MDALQEYFGIEAFDFETNKKKLIDNLNFLKAMSVEEQTFYKKWQEVQSFKGSSGKLNEVKAKIWTPTDFNDEQLTINEIENCNPTLVHVNSKRDNEDWTLIRIFGHTMSFDQTPGRFLKFLVTDGNKDNPRYIGAISVSSDVIAISDRDTYLGWTSDNKIRDKKLAHSAIGSCIMSTQPIGYNFLGGKLVAAMITTNTVRELWKQLYNQTLVGMTTTSLYGSYSMYNSLKWWHKCGTSAGKIAIKPDDSVYEIWHHWFQKNYPSEYAAMMEQKPGVSGPVTGAKQRVISKIFSELGIKSSDYVHGFERGTYYSCFYENTREFLCNKVGEGDLVMKPLFKSGKQSIIDWWKPKAIERYKKLKLESKLKSDVLYYSDMIGMDYKEAKEKYLNEVGR